MPQGLGLLWLPLPLPVFFPRVHAHTSYTAACMHGSLAMVSLPFSLVHFPMETFILGRTDGGW